MSHPSPFPPSTSTPGHGQVHLTLLPPNTPTFKTLNYTYPLKLIPSTPHRIPTPPDPNVPRPEPQSHGIEGEGGEVKQGEKPTQHVEDGGQQKPPQSSHCPLLFLLTYGGGLLAGDAINLSICLDAGTRLCITTQGTTKIFKPKPTTPPTHTATTNAPPLPLPPQLPTTYTAATSPAPANAAVSSQTLRVHLHPNSSLWYAPDPAQPFATSSYTQHQSFHLHSPSSTVSLGFVDWVIPGRVSRGEVWDFRSYVSRNEVWLVDEDESIRENRREEKGKGEGDGERLVLRDLQRLEQPGLQARMKDIGIVGTIILRGPVFSPLSTFFLNEFSLLPRIGGRDWDDDSSPSAPNSSSQPSTAAETQEAKEEDNEASWRKQRWAFERDSGVLWTAARVRGCVVVKVMAPGYEEGRRWVGEMVGWEGSVGREFGVGGLMFVR